MFYASNISDVTLADKSRVLSHSNFEEIFIESNTIEKIKYSQLNGEFALNLVQSDKTRKLIVRDSRIRQLESGLAEIVLSSFPDIFYELQDRLDFIDIDLDQKDMIKAVLPENASAKQ